MSCVFCDYAAGRFDPALIVFEDAGTFVVPSLLQKPGNRGHCLVVTRAHVPDLHALAETVAPTLLDVVRRAATAAKRAFAADGIGIRQNNGAAAGQDVFHLHVHVVPHFVGDDFDRAADERIDEHVRIEQAAALRAAWAAD